MTSATIATGKRHDRRGSLDERATIMCRAKWGDLEIPINATVRLLTRRRLRVPVLMIADAGRAWVRDRVALPEWPVGVWAVVTKSVRSA